MPSILQIPTITTAQRTGLVLLAAEIVYDSDLKLLYQGDGVTAGGLPVGGGAWGAITGAISSQADLQSALSLKANLASPTFTGTVTLPAGQVVNGVTLSTSAGTSAFLRGDGTYATPSGSGGVTDGDKGDITVSGTGTVWTVDPAAITLSKMANLAATTIIGNNTGLAATPSALSGTQVTAMLDVAGAAKGLMSAADKTKLDAITGTNTGDQTITLTGAVTGSGTGSFATTLAAGAVALANMANVATGTVFYRKTAGTGAPEVNTLATLKTDLGLTGTNSGDQTITLTGDVTGSGTGSFAATLATVNSNVGSFGSATQVATFTVDGKGRTTAAGNATISVPATAISDSTAAGRAVVTAATATAQTALFDVFTSAAKGLAPASGGGTTNFLRADGTWAAPAGGGGGGTPGGSTTQVQYNNAGAFAGAANVLIEGNELRLPVIATPTTPAASGVKVYSQTKTGRRDGPAMLFSSGREAMFQEDMAEFQTYWFQPASNSSANLGNGTLPMTITGTATAGVAQGADMFTLWPRVEARVGTAAVNAVAGYRGAGNFVRVGNDASAPGGFYFRAVWGPSTGISTATHRAMCGLSTSTVAPTDVEPSTLVDGIWMGWDAADTNVQMMHNDATGVATKIDLGASFPVPTVQGPIYQIELFSPNSATQSVQYRVIRYNTTARTVAAEATGTITTNLPLVTTLLSPKVSVSVGGTSSIVGVALYGMLIKLDY